MRESESGPVRLLAHQGAHDDPYFTLFAAASLSVAIGGYCPAFTDETCPGFYRADTEVLFGSGAEPVLGLFPGQSGTIRLSGHPAVIAVAQSTVTVNSCLSGDTPSELSFVLRMDPDVGAPD